MEPERFGWVWTLAWRDRDDLNALAKARRVPLSQLVREAIRAYLEAERAAHEEALRLVPPTLRHHAAYARKRGLGHVFYVNAWHEAALEPRDGFERSYMGHNGWYDCQSWVYLFREDRGVSIPLFELVIGA